MKEKMSKNELVDCLSQMCEKGWKIGSIQSIDYVRKSSRNGYKI